ncbi:Secretion system apparatus protein SsaT [Alteripontixanthobacter maritimus]|uniref:Flagellar biosynthetic protein FliR n=1 Tax=Alteripontixanthobacter maritimus TaxID=2161824 RepID=A0A369Q758_9SPHN|nr:flagellar biosynthetic protein FliR [Alteripontixanthobacter maritimus]RDC59127.1 Secretion system apparatus protein SsaT [Alteripontixanthobacter maritimus]
MILPDFGFGGIEDQLWMLLFVMIRCGAAMLAAPIFGAAGVPVQVRIVLAGALGVFILAWVPVTVPQDLFSLPGAVTIAGEVLIGLAMGFVLQLTFAAPVIGAELISGTMGMAIATAIDPNSGSQSGALGQYFGIVLTLVFLAVGGHLLWLDLVIESYRSLPPGAGAFRPEDGAQIAAFAARMFATGLAIALPVTLVLLLVQLATGVVSRSAPSLNLFALGLPAGILAGLVALIISFPLMTDRFVELSRAGIEQVAEVARI